MKPLPPAQPRERNSWRFVRYYPAPNLFTVDLPNGEYERRIGTYATLGHAIAARNEALKTSRLEHNFPEQMHERYS